MRVSNTGNLSQEVLSAEIVQLGSEFRLLPLANAVIEPHDYVEFSVSYTSVSDTAAAELIVVTGDRRGALDGRLTTRVAIEAVDSQPALMITPSVVEFDHQSEAPESRIVVVRNATPVAVSIVDVQATGPSGGFELVEGDLAGRDVMLQPSDEYRVELASTLPWSLGPPGRLVVTYIVPGTALAATAEVSLVAQALGPCAAITPEIDFGEVYVGMEGSGEVTIENCSRNGSGWRMVVSEVAVIGVDGTTVPTAVQVRRVRDLPFSLGPGQWTSVEVGYRPEQAGRSETALLHIRHSLDEGVPTLVSLTGVPLVNSCPTASATCSLRSGAAVSDEPLAVPLLSTVDCTSGDSTDPDGHALQAHTWTLTRPSDSRTLLNRVDGPSTSFFVDVPGTYEVSLDLADELGVPACQPARVVVAAIAADAE